MSYGVTPAEESLIEDKGFRRRTDIEQPESLLALGFPASIGLLWKCSWGDEEVTPKVFPMLYLLCRFCETDLHVIFTYPETGGATRVLLHLT
jgi:hypothetical protein